MYSRLSRSPAVLAVVCAVYFGLGQLGVAAGGFTGAANALWAPSGFALAAMVVLGRSVWLSVMAGAFFVHIAATGQVAPSLVVAVGSMLEALVGSALVDRIAGGPNVFRHPTTVFRFVAIAAFVSTPVGAAFGAAARSLAGSMLWGDFAYLWMTWWLANLTGTLVVAPFVILIGVGPFERGRWLEIVEGFLLLVVLVAVGLVVFGGRFPSDVQNYPLEFLCAPFLLWAAFRFGRRETATAILLLTGIAVWGTLQGFGPFVRDSPNEAFVLVQIYICVMSITGLVLAAAVAEHRHAEAQLRELATTDPLTGLVNYRRLIEVLRTEIARSSRTKRPFSVLFLDMNGLKKINDRYGHLVGSRALTRIAETLRSSTRSIDTPARFGGDEFAVVLPETGEEGGELVLRRICDKFSVDTVKPSISVSGGVAVFPRDGDSPTLLLRAADKLLYEAKIRTATERKAAVSARVSEKKTGTLF